jgi:hypothetical protein
MAPKKASEKQSPKKKGTSAKAVNVVETAHVPPSPVYLQFKDGSSLIYDAGLKDAETRIRRHRWTQFRESTMEKLQVYKELDDKQLKQSTKPTIANEVTAELNNINPVVIQFNDNSASVHPLGKDYVIEKLEGKDIRYRLHEYDDYYLAQDVAGIMNTRCTQMEPTCNKVMKEIFGMSK